MQLHWILVLDNAPINVKPHYPLYGQGWGVIGGFYTLTTPRGWGIRVLQLLLCFLRDRLCFFFATSISCSCKLPRMERTVLIQFETKSGTRSRPVTFCGEKEELLSATKEKFADIMKESSEIYFQIQDESWGAGFFVDLLD